MTVPTILILLALVLALFDEFEARGRSLLGWAVVFICIALAWGRLT